MIDIEKYNKLVDLPTDYDAADIVAFIPKPTDKDYKVGYIRRFFIQKANDNGAVIYEIRKSSFNTFVNNGFYKAVELDWRIIGDIEDVKKSNSASIRIASQTISKISLYLPNLLQFHKK